MLPRNSRYRNSFNSFNPQPQIGINQPTGGYYVYSGNPQVQDPNDVNNHNRYQNIDREIQPSQHYSDAYFNQRAIDYTQKNIVSQIPQTRYSQPFRQPVLDYDNSQPSRSQEIIQRMKFLKESTQKPQETEADYIPNIPVKIFSHKNNETPKSVNINNLDRFGNIKKPSLEEENPFDSSRFKFTKSPITKSSGITPVTSIKKPQNSSESNQEGFEEFTNLGNELSSNTNDSVDVDISKIYSEDYRKAIAPKTTLPSTSNLAQKRNLVYKKLEEEKTRQKIRKILARERVKANRQSIFVKIFIFILFITSSISALFVWNQYNLSSSNTGQIAGASDQKYSDFEEYNKWIKEKAGEYLPPEEDKDGDGLTNHEEFLIKSDPTSKNSCDENITDMENLLSLKNPATCKDIDLENKEELNLFSKIIDFEMVKKNFLEPTKEELKNETEEKKTSQNNLLEVFQVASFEEIDSINTEQIEENTVVLTKKKEYLKTIEKIDQYIKKYRSFDVYDRNYKEPVHPAIYLQVSLEYNVPLKYVLAVARKESRFGTDRYTNSGSLTRPGKYQNIYSIGLDDSGNNLGYKTWEDGVRAFGKWYQIFEQRGVNDCRKWKIYNPNGDYCKTIENLANEIQVFLES
jgi:hypothetical protein